MNKFFYTILPVLAVLIVFGAGCSKSRTTSMTDQQKETRTEYPGPSTTTKSEIQDEWTSKDGIAKLRFTDILEDGRPAINNPSVVYGTTTVFENQFSWRLKDSKGTLVAGGRAYANSPDSGLPGPFTIKVFFDQSPTTTDGFFEVYDNSPKDGAEISLLKVPVEFGNLLSAALNEVPPTTSDLYVYFPNKQKDPNFLDCSNVYPVKYTVLDDEFDQVAAMALHALLKGPTSWSLDHGFFTSLPADVNMPEIKTENGKIILNFDETLEQGVAGSCRVTSIRSQIEKTVTETLKHVDPTQPAPKVVISINGRTEDILQP